jgi:hypothetical protein
MRTRTLDEERAHRAAITKIVDDWQAGIISLATKRERISEENLFYHGDHTNSLTTGKTLTLDTAPVQSVPSAIAERTRQLELVPRSYDEEEEREEWWKR